MLLLKALSEKQRVLLYDVLWMPLTEQCMHCTLTETHSTCLVSITLSMRSTDLATLVSTAIISTLHFLTRLHQR